MIRRITTTAIVGAAAAAALVAGTGTVTSPAVAPAVALASTATDLNAPPPPPHRTWGPGFDGNHGPWNGRGGFGKGGGWDGVGGGWDGHRWWVSRQRCEAGHGHVNRRNDRWHSTYCQGGLFNGAPIR
jgi:hypothetical protein